MSNLNISSERKEKMCQKQYKSLLTRYYLFSFFSGMHLFGAVLVPFFTEWGHTTLLIAQLLQSWFTFWIFVFEIPTGVIADTLGRKYSVALGCFTVAIATLVYASYPNVGLFFLGEFLFALGVALISGADNALIYDSLLTIGLEEKANQVFGKSKSLHLFGIMTGSLLGGMIAEKYGLNIPMFLTFFPTLVAGVIVLTIHEPKTVSNNETKRFKEVVKVGLTSLYKSKKLSRWVINSTIVSGSAYFVIWLYQPMMMSLDLPVGLFGWAHAGLVFVEIIIAANFQKLTNIFGSLHKYLYFSALSTAVGLIIAAIWPGYFSLVFMLILSGGFGLTRTDIMSMEMNKSITNNRATVQSAANMTRRITQALLNPLVGFTADRSVVAALLIVGLIPLTSFFVKLDKLDKNE